MTEVFNSAGPDEICPKALQELAEVNAELLLYSYY